MHPMLLTELANVPLCFSSSWIDVFQEEIVRMRARGIGNSGGGQKEHSSAPSALIGTGSQQSVLSGSGNSGNTGAKRLIVIDVNGALSNR